MRLEANLVSTAFNISHKSYHTVLPVPKANHINILAHAVTSNQKSTENAATIPKIKANQILIVQTYFFLTNPVYAGLANEIIVLITVAHTVNRVIVVAICILMKK
ncbi:MAG: hypothetical protein U0L26_08190 [Cellulosilyticum sp.]|nr:hypothetical protein [Cellulosilyticum sp.]